MCRKAIDIFSSQMSFIYSFVNLTISMSGKHIQLSFGIVRDKSKEKSVMLNLFPNFRKDFLFDQVPYLAHLGNSVIVDVLKNGIVGDLSLQKYVCLQILRLILCPSLFDTLKARFNFLLKTVSCRHIF